MEKLYESIITDSKVQQMLEINWKQVAAAGLIGASMLGTPAMAKDVPKQGVHQNVGEANIVAKVIAGEAAGEGEIGMLAVACVIQNRMIAGAKTAEQVVTKPSQFSAYADKDLMNRNYEQVKGVVNKIAKEIGHLNDITGGATHYVTKELYNRKKGNPNSWVSKMQFIKIIGNHVFMKEK